MSSNAAGVVPGDGDDHEVWSLTERFEHLAGHFADGLGSHRMSGDVRWRRARRRQLVGPVNRMSSDRR